MYADLILHNAKIYTVNPLQPWAEAVACNNGCIFAVGQNDEILLLAGPNTRRINAHQKLVLPGLTDAHIHFLQAAVRQHQVNLFGVRDFEQVCWLIQQAVDNAKPDEWVQGYGWDENLWDIQPHRRYLDKIASRNPVVLARMDMHTWWVNTIALQISGVTVNTSNPPNSHLERDADGQLTGLLREWNAIRLVEQHIPDYDDEVLAIWLREFIKQAHQLGLTGIHDQRVELEGSQSLRLFQSLNRRGELNLRVHHNIAADYLAEAATLGLQAGFGNNRLWLGHVKTFADGTMGSRTAWMLDPFEREPDNTGLVVTSPEKLVQLTWQANQAGFPMSVHAIGDRAVREVMAVLGEYPPPVTGFSPGLPHRIEHVQIIHPADLPHLARHKIFASVQPVHLLTDWPTADKVWGQRARYAYAFRSLRQHGIPLAFGSDAPVAPPNPMLGIYAAVTRQNEQGQPSEGWYPQEQLSVVEAVEGYTLGPARLAGKEPWQGSIAPGKWADMIVLSGHIFDIPADELLEVAVDMTIFNGEVVHQAQ